MAVVPLVLMAAGTGLQMFSQWMANIDQAKAEYENAKFYKEQGDVARSQMYRDMDIADREYEFRKGATIGAEASGGVDVGSGSAINNIAAVAAAKVKELSAIKLQCPACLEGVPHGHRRCAAQPAMSRVLMSVGGLECRGALECSGGIRDEVQLY